MVFSHFFFFFFKQKTAYEMSLRDWSSDVCSSDLELGQAFRRFGSEVHLVNRSPGLLGKEEPEAVALIQRRLESEGVHLHLGVKAVGGERRDDQKFFVLEAGGQTVK